MKVGVLSHFGFSSLHLPRLPGTTKIEHGMQMMHDNSYISVCLLLTLKLMGLFGGGPTSQQLQTHTPSSRQYPVAQF